MNEFSKAKDYIEAHGLIAFQTDTVMGIGCIGTDNLSVLKLFEIKHRPFVKPLYLIAYSISQILEYTVAIPSYAFDLMENHFPGGLTLILNSSKKLFTSPNVIGDTIGVRIPDAKELLEFLAYLQYPILNTSANISGKNPLETGQEVNKAFREDVFFVKFEYNIKMSGTPSTIVDCTRESPRIIRQGNVNV